MASQVPPVKGVAFTLYFTLYKNDGTVVVHPGAYTKKIIIDGGVTGDIAAAPTEEDITYGCQSVVLSATEMTGDAIWIYITDDTSGTVPFTCTIYTAAQSLDTMMTAISSIGSGTGAAINFEVNDDNTAPISPADTILSSITQLGTASGGTTFANTQADDGTFHTIASDGNDDFDWVYKFVCGSGRTASKVVIRAAMAATADIVTVKAYDHVGGDWETIGSISGTTETLYDLPLYSKHTGTGANAGLVYIEFNYIATDPGTINIDLCYVQAQNLGQTVGYADGAIWIGGANTNTTPYVDGTADNPVTYAAAKTLSTYLGITRFRVRNNTTITLDATIANQTFIGKNWTLALGSQAVTNAYIEGATVSGVSSGTGSTFLDCKIGTCTINSTTLLRCTLTGTLTTIASGAYNFIQCVDGIPGETNAVIVLTASATVGFRLWSGGINLNAMAATNIVVIDGAGKLIIDSNCVAGEIRLRGPFAVTDNKSGGFTGLTQTERYATSVVGDAIWDEVITSGHTGVGKAATVINDILTDTGTTIPALIPGKRIGI